MATWIGPVPPKRTPLTPFQWIRALSRLAALIALLIVLMACFWLARLIELFVGGRTLSGFIIWIACVTSAVLCGVRIDVKGAPMHHAGARVCNHSTWLDIFVLRAASQMFFVAKAEVRAMPVIGFVADQTGTMFIERKRTEAKRQEAMFLERLNRGDRLCFFPEGTSSDGLRVLPFKSTLFNVFLSPPLVASTWVQPVTVIYHAPLGEPADFYGWWDTIGVGESMIQILGKSVGGVAEVVFHDAVRAADFADRKALTRHCEAEIMPTHAAAMKRAGIVPRPERD